ncbi:MAG: NAD(P)H-binding protein [Sphingomonadales bacterium]|nr:NAD(P)H-binding protein [Sphingomonadales bacterium]
MTDRNAPPAPLRRVALLGASGTIGRATAAALIRRGHEVVCFVRPRAGQPGPPDPVTFGLPAGVALCPVDPTDAAALGAAFADERFAAVISCLASRTGEPADAWEIDHRAQSHALAAARAAGVAHFVLLSAICVQKPLLAFQRAKLAFEAELAAAGLRYSIVRPTAFFKSLSGQVERLRRGKPFLIFGDGRRTACKPISDADLADYLVGCLDNEARWNRVLPIGGPGPALTPREQGEMLFALLGQTPRFRSVPIGILDAMIGLLATLGRVAPRLAAKAELARIGRYYATESMLVLDPATGHYEAEATPSTGSDRLIDHYRALIAGEIADQRGDHAVF